MSEQDKYVVSPSTDKYHKQGSGLEPACVARLHNSDAEYRISLTTKGKEPCGHPECYGGDNEQA